MDDSAGHDSGSWNVDERLTSAAAAFAEINRLMQEVEVANARFDFGLAAPGHAIDLQYETMFGKQLYPIARSAPWPLAVANAGRCRVPMTGDPDQRLAAQAILGIPLDPQAHAQGCA